MTIITIYPLFSNDVNLPNIVLYATNNSLTVTNIQYTHTDSSTGQISCIITVSQTLTSGQKTAITTIFQGTAYILFS